MEYEKFLDLYTDLVFVEQKVQKADVILIPEAGIRSWQRGRLCCTGRAWPPLCFPREDTVN